MTYLWGYKKPRGHRIQVVRVIADNEREALRNAPSALPNNFLLYGMIGVTK